jgi:hypothetical protein
MRSHVSAQVSPGGDGRLVVNLGQEAGVSYLPERISEKLYRRQVEGARVPGIDDIRSHLARITAPVPAQVAWGTQGRTDRLRLYINGRYVLVLEVAKNGRSYFLTDVRPLGLRDQDQIVRCEFALTAQSWQLYDHPGDVPDDLDAQWAAVSQGWKARPNHGAAGGKTGALPRQHREYLDNLDLIIEKGREIELTGKPADRMCRYQRITPAAVQRRTAQSIYKFQVMGESRLVAGTKVHIDEHPGLRGEVREIRDSLITVKFDQPLDFSQIPALGAFVASPNTVSFDKQAEAVEALREQRSRNPRLLDVLVDRRFQPFQPATASPAERLDPSQEAAFRMALAELRGRVARCGSNADLRAGRAVAAARRLADSLGAAAALPPVSADPTALAQFSAAAGQAVALARRRLLLLRKWRATLERRTEQLYPELIRYADVVGATCIGVGASKYLSNIDFSVAIIDEAGQITAPNLLVPLVRAERAVLVGDHVQLPPYAETALVTWARAEDPVLADIVAKSAFELIFPSIPDSNRKLLNTQRRMPHAIGSFISNQFYGGQLGTDTDRPDRDELFASPLAFIDTAELPSAERRERHPHHGEPWPDTSWVNDAEAALIAGLVAYYDARGSDWVVIVPFSAQEGRISALLGKRLGDEERAASRVASVDSFQGGEHDTVIFGFTRSNSKGAVGFFKDVRRSNVAFSRARYRMIMVGDLSTLVNASDTGFRSMMEALHDHLRLRGDLPRYREVAALLRGEAGQ